MVALGSSGVSSAARTITPPPFAFSLAMMMASGPMSARTVASAAVMSSARKVRSCMGSDLSQRAQFHRRVDLALRHHHGLRPKALDDRTHERAHLRRGEQHGYFTLLARLVEAVAYSL